MLICKKIGRKREIKHAFSFTYKCKKRKYLCIPGEPYKKCKGNLSFTDKHYIVHITFTKKSEA